MQTARAARWASVARWCWAYIRRAPGTYIWLAVLFAHSVVLRHVSPQTADRILEQRSTNLHYLAVSPVRVLISSAFWIAGAAGSPTSCCTTWSTSRSSADWAPPAGWP
nr:rhomboid-like protein [Kitasatospora acidiphila]